MFFCSPNIFSGDIFYYDLENNEVELVSVS